MKTKDLRNGGTLAIGIILGVLGCILLSLFYDFFGFGFIEDSALFGAIIGAVVAGVIGVCGQLVVLLQSDAMLEEQRVLSERARLETMLARVVRLTSTFLQLKGHFESEHPFDNLVFLGLQSLPKPMKINDLPERLSAHDLTLPLSMADRRFFNLLNVFDSCICNFLWISKEYDGQAQAFLQQLQDSGELNFKEGAFSGYGSVNMVKFHELKDLYEHYIETVYPGLVISKKLSDLLVEKLKTRHGVDFSFSDRLTKNEWKALFESVDVGDFADDLGNNGIA